MPKYKVTFTDEIESESEIGSYDALLNYLKECVINEDVSAFNFEKINHQNNEENNEKI